MAEGSGWDVAADVLVGATGGVAVLTIGLVTGGRMLGLAWTTGEIDGALVAVRVGAVAELPAVVRGGLDAVVDGTFVDLVGDGAVPWVGLSRLSHNNAKPAPAKSKVAAATNIARRVRFVWRAGAWSLEVPFVVDRNCSSLSPARG